MLRILALVLVALVALPSASAAQPDASIKVTPPPSGQAGEPYYLWVNVTDPEGPSPGDASDDCWKDAQRPPPGPEGAALQLAGDIAAWDPLQEMRLSGWFPECIATQVRPHDEATVRASYDVTTGRYYVLVDQEVVGLALPLSPTGFTMTAAMIEATGTTGLTMVTDCEECPPPV